MARIFISYKRADKEKVFAIKDKIEAATGEKIDLDGIESHAQFANVIMPAIGEAEIFLFMYSKEHSLIKDYENDWTIRELIYAKKMGKQILFINLDETRFANWLEFMYGDVQQYDVASETSFNKLVEHIKITLKHKPYNAPQCMENLTPNIGLVGSTNNEPIEHQTESITYEARYSGTSHECYASADGDYCGATILGGVIGYIVGGISDLFQGEHNIPNYDNVYASLFSSTEVMRKSHFLVQLFLHLYEESEMVKSFAKESQKYAERRDYIPLQCRLKKGDKVDVHLNIYGETLLMSEMKSVIWQGKFTKCSFDYFIPKDIDVDELSCMAMLSVNGVPIGEMRFITRIVDDPRQLNPEIISHKYNKVFISYAHKDEARVKSFHEGLNVAGTEHFFDRTYLKTGDIFPQIIQDYIDTADLFVLFWSENAAESEYVRRERMQALKRAFPQVKPEQQAKLRIYPISIEPRADLPTDMRDYYHFGEL